MKAFYLSTYHFQDGVKIFLFRSIIFKEHNGSVSLLFLGGTCNILTSIRPKKKDMCLWSARASVPTVRVNIFFFQFNSFATLPVLCLGLLNVQLQLVVHEQCTRLKNTKY